MKRILLKASLAVIILSAGLAVSYALVAVGIRAAEQQNRLYFMVRDIKRAFIPAQPVAAKATENNTMIAGHAAFILAPKIIAGMGQRPWVWYAPTLPGLPAEEEKSLFEHWARRALPWPASTLVNRTGAPAAT